MLEECTYNLIECERILARKVNNVSLLGQITLSDRDIQKLGSLISSSMAIDPYEGSSFVWNRTPACIACFLVWIGIRQYHAGDYWSAVHNLTSLPDDPNWHIRWGHAFLKYLRSKGFPSFADVGGLRFVTPILAHGGIPDYCLNDFFMFLLIPIVKGHLEVDVSDVENILYEWQEHATLLMFTDKPVRRFLLYGGNVAKDFLSRCIEMVQRAYEEGVVPTAHELDLPDRVVESFENWWASYGDEHRRRPSRQELRSQFRRPVILLAYELGEVYIKIPQQRIMADMEITTVSIEVAAGQDLITKQIIRAYRRRDLIETEETQIPIYYPAEMYEVRLCSDSKTLWTWNFKGLSKERPWLAFDRSTHKMIQEENLPRMPVWIVLPRHCSMEPDLYVIEEGQSFYGRWTQYCVCLYDLSSIEQFYLIESGTRIKIPVTYETTPNVELIGGQRIEHVLYEGESVYVNLPSLSIPLSGQINRWYLSIIPINQEIFNRRITYNLADLITEQEEVPVLQISLSDPRLLGADAIGCFVIRLRGPLGKNYQLRFAILPNLKVEFDQTLYVPSLENITDAIVSITAEPITGITVEEPGRILNEQGNKWVIKVPYTESRVNCSLKVLLPNERIVEIPIEIRIPRLRLAIRGLNAQSTWQWNHIIQEISIDQYREAGELFILTEIPYGELVTLTLQNTNQHVTQSIHHGKARFDIKPFYDTLIQLGQPLISFYLTLQSYGISTQEIPVLSVRTKWTIEELNKIEQVRDEYREIHLTWHDKGQVRNRCIRLWNMWRPWEMPLSYNIPNDVSEVQFQNPVFELPPVDYRIEFIINNPWHGIPPHGLSPDVNDNTVFDLSFGDSEEKESYQSNLPPTLISALEKVLSCCLRAYPRETVCAKIRSYIITEALKNEELYALAGVLISWISYSEPSEDEYIDVLWKHVSGNGIDKILPQFLCELARYCGDKNIKDFARQLAITLGLTQSYLQSADPDWLPSSSDRALIWDLYVPLGLFVDLTGDNFSSDGIFVQRLFRTLGEQPLKDILHWPVQVTEDFEWPPACSGEFSECLICRLSGELNCTIGVELDYSPDYYGGNEIYNLDILLSMNEENIRQILESLRLHPIGLFHADAYADAVASWLLDMKKYDRYATTYRWADRSLDSFKSVLEEISVQQGLQPLANAIMRRLASSNQNYVCNVPFMVGSIALVQRLIAWGLYRTNDENRWKKHGIKAYQFAQKIYEHDLCLFDLSLCIIIHEFRSGDVVP